MYALNGQLDGKCTGAGVYSLGGLGGRAALVLAVHLSWLVGDVCVWAAVVYRG